MSLDQPGERQVTASKSGEDGEPTLCRTVRHGDSGCLQVDETGEQPDVLPSPASDVLPPSAEETPDQATSGDVITSDSLDYDTPDHAPVFP
jgi:hypothetical protein